MRVDSPDMGWHGQKDRILSIDFHPFNNQFVSAGSDEQKFLEQEQQGTEGCIKIWQIINDGKNLHPNQKNIKILYGLYEADKNTNVVRYSPNGAYLASGSDDKCITLWKKAESFVSINRPDRIMRWSSKGKLMGHTEDVLDLRWTRDSRFIVSSGLDKRIFIWNVEKRYHVKVLDQHQKFVQGVALDLTFEHIISCSNDRTVKVWKAIKTKKSQTEFYCKKSLKRFDYQKNEDQDNPEQKGGFRIFADQSVPTFFRRPDFSPDGQLFVLPAGTWLKPNQTKSEYCAFLYRKNFIEQPSYCIPTNGQPALICKFCPLLFKKQNPKTGLFQADYYMIYAIATTSTLLIYSTNKVQPLYGIGNYHYAALTDMTWRGAQMLAVSSSDGYCSFVIFEKNELGQVYEPPQHLANLINVKEFVNPPPNTKNKQIGSKATSQMSNQVRVEYRETENGIKKKIIPKKIGDL